jgi:hypothetical protein
VGRHSSVNRGLQRSTADRPDRAILFAAQGKSPIFPGQPAPPKPRGSVPLQRVVGAVASFAQTDSGAASSAASFGASLDVGQRRSPHADHCDLTGDLPPSPNCCSRRSVVLWPCGFGLQNRQCGAVPASRVAQGPGRSPPSTWACTIHLRSVSGPTPSFGPRAWAAAHGEGYSGSRSRAIRRARSRLLRLCQPQPLPVHSPAS